MTRTLLVLFLAPVVALCALAAPASAKIGVASLVKNDVSGTVGGNRRVLGVGTAVFANEVVSTGAKSSAQLLFRDETSLTLGENAQLRLDRFVYDPNAQRGDIAVSIGKGAFRFITGSADPSSYKIRTPVATVGVRGTIVEGYIGDDGGGAIVVVEGQIVVTLNNGGTVTLNAGEYIAFDAAGKVIAGPAAWRGPTLDLDAGVQFVLDEMGNLLHEGGDVLPRWNKFNDALDSRDLDITFPPSRPDPQQQPTGTFDGFGLSNDQ